MSIAHLSSLKSHAALSFKSCLDSKDPPFISPLFSRPVLQTLSYLKMEMLIEKISQVCRAFESSYGSLVRGSEIVARVLSH